MNLGIVIQARLGSTRLPNKIILDFNKGRGLLDIILDKVNSRFNQYPIILATGDEKNNLRIGELAKKYNVHFFIGSENDVLRRFIDAAESQKLTHLIRICSDNPFIDMDLIDSLVSSSDISKFDYIGFKDSRGIPVIRTHVGIFAEIVSLDALKICDSILEKDSVHREHVTSYIYETPRIFNVNLVDSPEIVFSRNDIRLTLDTPQDLNLLSELYNEVGEMKIPEIVRFLDANKEKYIDKMLTNIKNSNK